MLTLPIKKKWFDMLLSGEKKEEYREIKLYYATRLKHEIEGGAPYIAKFVNGYRRDAPYFTAAYHLEIRAGKEEWGADRGVVYYVLVIEKIICSIRAYHSRRI